MSTFDRLARIARKAIATAQQQSSGSGSGSGSGDWRSIVRSAADAITGDGRGQQGHGRQGYERQEAVAYGARNRSEDYRSSPRSGAGSVEDRQAIARYDYLMRTADPEQIERVHQEAFARLTPTQRLLVQERMNEELPAHERPRSAEPADLARSAARSEASHPGALRGLLARVGGSGGGRGAMLGGAAAAAGLGFAAGGILTAVAGGAILSTVAAPLLAQAMDFGVDFDSLANGVDLGSLADGVDFEGVGGSFAEAGGEWTGDAVSGFGDVAGGLGDFRLPGLDDLFGR
ncbi:cation-transporting ATPase [Naasia lichenicola]|uniref:Cation-transporting ATPase n=1 Tax=Naasia lichenicola TaxID=2565933 RepID=A0A4S4FJ19_9MICO|nr:cation-transporting ATPase [Naasia lichenicola]THG29884.1 cation-transporting ATPase [Naasia lichenicola]